MNYGKTKVIICKDEFDLGRQSALAVSNKIKELLTKKETLKVVFAAGESQMTFFDFLSKENDIPWHKINCFNIDDFHDLKMPEKFTCGYQTTKQLYDKVKPKSINLVKYNAPDAEAEAKRFEALLKKDGDIDILCQGIGTSGHLALNEPNDTDFNEKKWVRVTDIVEQSKIQLRADPNFKALGYIPEKGITITIPGILAAKNIFTIVPLALKRPIMERFFATNTPTTELPASILRNVEGFLFIDRNSCPNNLLPN